MAVMAQGLQQYFNHQWQKVDVDKAVFYTETHNYGNLFYRAIYYLREDKLQMEGFFSDAKCTKGEGALYSYYANGVTEKDCFYENNKLNGLYRAYYENGAMKDSAFYHQGKLLGTSYTWYRDGMPKDSITLQKDGSGVAVSWHQNGMPAAAGYFAAAGVHRGTWQYFHHNGKTSAREKYVQGVLVEKKYFDIDGNQDTGAVDNDRPAAFTGGDTAWKNYLSLQAIIPQGWDNFATGDITVVVNAIIDREGKLKNIFISVPFHPAFDKIALAAVTNSPQWLPAIEHHRLMETEVTLPISFTKATTAAGPQ